MTDLIFKGKVIIDSSNKDSFIRAFNDLLIQHNASYAGTLKSYEFEDVEIIEDETENN